MKIYGYDVYLYDFVRLVLHQTQCNFQQSRSGSNSTIFLVGRALHEQLTLHMNSAAYQQITENVLQS